MIKIIIHADYMERKILLEFEQKGTLLKRYSFASRTDAQHSLLTDYLIYLSRRVIEFETDSLTWRDKTKKQALQHLKQSVANYKYYIQLDNSDIADGLYDTIVRMLDFETVEAVNDRGC
ncbi:MAG: hypothetical protein M0R38_11760 [Bacteroidia bacterium]|nr:hypothetical protein [Bacteroidia bacterium]